MGRQCTEGMAGSPYSTQRWCWLLEYSEVTLYRDGPPGEVEKPVPYLLEQCRAKVTMEK